MVCACVPYSGGSCWSRGILWSLALKRDLQMECQECRHFGSVEKVEKQTNMKGESLNVLSLTLSLKVLCVRVPSFPHVSVCTSVNFVDENYDEKCSLTTFSHD